MKRTLPPRACAFLLLLAAGPALADADVFGSVGVRHMHRDFWAPVEDQASVGLMGDVSLGPSPVFVDAAIQYGYADATDCGFSGVDCTSQTVEGSLGLKYLRRNGLVRPFAGGGVVATHASIEADGPGGKASDSDSTYGYFAEGGLLFRFARHVNVGLDVRYIGGTRVDIAGVRGDADAVVVGVIAGFGWGGEWPPRRGRRPPRTR